MMNAGEVSIKVGISLTRQEYSVFKEGIKDDKCGWSKKPHLSQINKLIKSNQIQTKLNWIVHVSGFATAGSKFLSIMHWARMVSSGNNGVYTGSGLRGVIPYVQCVAAVFLSQVCSQ
jgi:hypothetical protein